MTAGEPNFATLLRSFRGRAALTQEELAERAGLTVNAIGSLERGVRTRPYPHTVRALSDALGLTEPERANLAAAAQPRLPPKNSAASQIIGRELEAEHVATLLGTGAARLVTLTGAGGVGKTTLAKAVAARLRGELRDEAIFVDVSSITEPKMVLPAVAAAFGLPESAEPLAVLTERLKGTMALVVLDNLEQVAPVGSQLAALLEGCSSLRLLATSRAPLRIRAEHEVVVAPLPVPDPWLKQDVATVQSSPAVRLLLDRCARMGAPMQVTESNATVLAQLCRHADGLPLAIELIAAQARAMSLETLLTRLGQALERSGPRDLPSRQRTLGATLEWSMSLLSERDREVFIALAAFSGSFTLEAAEALLGGAADTLSVLSELVEQSLLMTAPGPEARYRLLEPVRQYAVRSTPPDLRRVHAGLYLDAARRSRRTLRGDDLASALDSIDLDHANHLASHQYLIDQGRHEEAIDLVHGLAMGALLRGHARQWRDKLDLSGLSGLHPTARGRYSATAGLLDYAVSRRESALAELTEAHAVAQEAGDDLVAAEAALFGSLVSLNLGDVAQATRLAEAARGPSLPWADTMLRLIEGQVSLLAGDLDEAAAQLDESERLARALGNAFLIVVSLNMRATVTERRGDLAQTCRLLVDSVERSVAARMVWPLAFALPALAGVAMRLDESHVAGRLLGAAASFTGSPSLLGVFPASRQRSEADIDLLRVRLGPRFGVTIQAGRQLQLEEVARLARNLVVH